MGRGEMVGVERGEMVGVEMERGGGKRGRGGKGGGVGLGSSFDMDGKTSIDQEVGRIYITDKPKLPFFP